MKILLGLTGSVASVLYMKLIEKLGKFGNVEVILTEHSKCFIDRYRHGNPPVNRIQQGIVIWDDEDEWHWEGNRDIYKKDDSILHIDLRNQCGVLVIAPCSANTLAKLANGICDNLLTSVARAWDMNRPIIIAPAMNTEMWNHPITQEHIDKLKEWGYKIVFPQSKMLACGTEGMGAMANIDEIIKEIEDSIQWIFPLSRYSWDREKCSGIPIGNHPGAFAVQRKHSCHTGVDLYADEKTNVHAVEAGKVVCIEPFTGPKDNSPWWLDTSCILIEGSTGVVCYGEIEPPLNIRIGQNVQKGEWIGRVKRVIPEGKEHPEIFGWKPNMLHIELYPHGRYTPSTGFEKDKNDLIDPTPFLLNSQYRPFKELQ